MIKEKNIITLPKEFEGTGEVKGAKFTQVYADTKYYIYEVINDGYTYYELIKRTSTPTVVDFENRIYSETEEKEVYPSSKKFGTSGWTFKKLELAKEKLAQLHDKHRK